MQKGKSAVFCKADCQRQEADKDYRPYPVRYPQGPLKHWNKYKKQHTDKDGIRNAVERCPEWTAAFRFSGDVPVKNVAGAAQKVDNKKLKGQRFCQQKKYGANDSACRKYIRYVLDFQHLPKIYPGKAKTTIKGEACYSI